MPAAPSHLLASANWWAISLAACVLSGLGLTNDGYHQVPGSFGSTLLWSSLTVVIIALALEAWRDLYETAKHVAWVGAGVTLFSLFVGVYRASTLALVVGGCGAVAWAMSLAYRAWNQRASSGWPDVLREHVEPFAIHEEGDVQFAGASRCELMGGHGGDVVMRVQNCVDAPRTIYVELKPESKVSDANRAVLTPSDSQVELKGGEVAKVYLHCVAVGRAQGMHMYSWQAVTTGRGGRRVRRRRAKSLRVPLLTELVSLFSALSIASVGRRVTFLTTPGPSDVLAERPTFRVESVWLPKHEH